MIRDSTSNSRARTQYPIPTQEPNINPTKDPTLDYDPNLRHDYNLNAESWLLIWDQTTKPFTRPNYQSRFETQISILTWDSRSKSRPRIKSDFWLDQRFKFWPRFEIRLLIPTQDHLFPRKIFLEKYENIFFHIKHILKGEEEEKIFVISNYFILYIIRSWVIWVSIRFTHFYP